VNINQEKLLTDMGYYIADYIRSIFSVREISLRFNKKGKFTGYDVTIILGNDTVLIEIPTENFEKWQERKGADDH
jgi:hypothetical protein